MACLVVEPASYHTLLFIYFLFIYFCEKVRKILWIYCVQFFGLKTVRHGFRTPLSIMSSKEEVPLLSFVDPCPTNDN